MKIVTRTNIVFLEVRTFVETCAIGAEHYYGTVKAQECMYRKNEAEFSARIRRTIGSAEAAELNRKDGGDFHSAGQGTDRFPTEAAVVNAAVKYCRETFPKLRALLNGIAIDDVPRWPCRVFWTPDKSLTKRLNAIHAAYTQAEDDGTAVFDGRDSDVAKRLCREWREAWKQS